MSHNRDCVFFPARLQVNLEHELGFSEETTEVVLLQGPVGLAHEFLLPLNVLQEI